MARSAVLVSGRSQAAQPHLMSSRPVYSYLRPARGLTTSECRMWGRCLSTLGVLRPVRDALIKRVMAPVQNVGGAFPGARA